MLALSQYSFWESAYNLSQQFNVLLSQQNSNNGPYNQFDLPFLSLPIFKSAVSLCRAITFHQDRCSWERGATFAALTLAASSSGVCWALKGDSLSQSSLGPLTGRHVCMMSCYFECAVFLRGRISYHSLPLTSGGRAIAPVMVIEGGFVCQ